MRRETSSASTRVVGLATVFASVVAIAAWWIGTADEPEVVAREAETSAPRSDVAEGGNGTDETLRQVDAGAAAFAKDGAVDAKDAVATEARTRHHVAVRVIDARTKAPVADAQVVADPFDADLFPRLLTWRQSRYAMNLVDGEKATTDAAGIAWLRLRQGAQVAATKDGLFGARVFELEHLVPGGLEVRIEPLSAFVVRVVGGDGAPRRDVPIGIVTRQRGGEIAPVERTMPVGETDVDGRLEVRLAEFVDTPRAPDSVEVFVRAPGLQSVRAEVAPGRQQVELKLPPYGSARLRAVGADRMPIPDQPDWSVSLTLTEPKPEEEIYASALRAYGAAGEAHFPFVGLGQVLEAGFSDNGRYFSETLTGPVAVGQEVVHTFAIDHSKSFAVTCRVLTAENEPLVAASVAFFADEQIVGIRRTGSDGRAALQFELGGERTACALHVVASSDVHGVALSAPKTIRTAQSNDFGDLVLARREPLATGVLVADGPPGPGTRLLVRAKTGADWQLSLEYLVLLEDDGRFTVHRIANASRPCPPLRLAVHTTGYQPIEPVDFRAGDHLRVELKRSPRFFARVLLDPAIDWFVARYGLDLLVFTQEGDRQFVSGRLVDGEWVFETNSITPGVHRLALESGAASDDLAGLDGVRVFVGEDPDPRLLPWDLRSTVQLLTVRLQREDGSRLAVGGTVMRRRSLDGEWENAGSFDRGIAQSLTTAVPSDLCLDLPGQGTIVKKGVLGTIDVVVPEPKTIAVAFPGMPRLADGSDPAVTVLVAEGWQRANGLPEFASTLVASSWDAGSHRLLLRLSGAVDVRVEVRRDRADDSPLLGALEVKVPFDRSEIDVPCPPEIAAALAPFAERRPGGSR